MFTKKETCHVYREKNLIFRVMIFMVKETCYLGSDIFLAYPEQIMIGKRAFFPCVFQSTSIYHKFSPGEL